MTADTSILSDPPSLRLRGPTDLVVTVPYLLGFVPERSVVVVALDEDQHVALVARVDLPPLSRPPGTADLARLRRVGAQAATRIGPVAVRAGAATALGVVYPAGGPEHGRAVGWRGFADAFGEALAEQSLELIECLSVVAGRWWSLQCLGDPCCPAGGRSLPPTGTTEAEARAVLAGLTVLPSRADVGRRLAPAPPAERDAVAGLMGAVAVDPGDGLALVEATLERWQADRQIPSSATQALPAADAARLLGVLADVRIRDAVSLCRSAVECDAAVALWTELVRLAPTGWLAAPASLLAAASYQAGNGVLAGIAADAALAEDADHVLASQLVHALEVGLGPDQMRPVFELGSAAARATITAMS